MIEPITYRITPADPGAHIYTVVCTIADPDPDGQLLSLPAWIPGSYLIRDYARHVVRLSARCAGTALPVVKMDKSAWRCEPCTGPLRIEYDVYANDLSVRGALLDMNRGFFNGVCVFMMVHGRTDRPCSVSIERPDGPRYADWQVATAMVPDSAPLWGFGGYRADDYDELIDHPVEMGNFRTGEFEVAGVPHRLAISGRRRADIERLTADLKKLCGHHVRFFGEPPPMDRYLFLVTTLAGPYGGLEHRASTSLMCRRSDLPGPNTPQEWKSYRRFLGLCSHEYFHTWHIKRIKPAVFQPYDLSREAHTRLMWVFEGITSYYDDLALQRSGLISVESYLELLGETVTRVGQMPGRFKQSLADASFDAWTRHYRPDENTPNACVSYYTKGALAALALDLRLRELTDGAKSLDDVMHALWEHHGRTGRGVPEEGFEALTSAVAGEDLGEFFDLLVRSTAELPLERLLATVGIGLRFRAPVSLDDPGGPPDPRAAAMQTSLGARSRDDSGRILLTHVYDGGAAQRAGLSAEDELLAIDGIRVTLQNLPEILNSHAPGDEVSCTFYRREELMSVRVRLQAPEKSIAWLTLDERIPAHVRERRAAWLAGTPAAART
ncbi:MAG TPA: PDZ domain-containing protein [Gammaproteobacteria bacterium]|nr:PDZ domain-containing protein [Gammaproteobacteria bacterium]